MDILTFKEIKYAYSAALVPNFIILVYTGFKLIQLGQKSGPANNDKLYGTHRRIVFSLIFFGLLSRTFFELDQLLLLFGAIKQTIGWDCIADILDNLPTVLFISLASFFSNAWHKHYSSFENNETSSLKHKMYAVFLLVVNIVMYAVNIGLVIGYWENFNLRLLSYFHASFLVTLIIITFALAITGKILHDQTLNFVNYTGRKIKSAVNFKKIYYLLIACCVLKCLDSGISLYLANFAKDGQLNEKVHFYLGMISVIAFDAFAEPVFFLCLISLLNISASKCETFLNEVEVAEKSFQTSFNSQEFSVEAH